MGLEVIEQINECIELTDRLKNRFESNTESFENCVSHNIFEEYVKLNDLAAERCDTLRSSLLQLRAEEEMRMLSGG